MRNESLQKEEIGNSKKKKKDEREDFPIFFFKLVLFALKTTFQNFILLCKTHSLSLFYLNYSTPNIQHLLICISKENFSFWRINKVENNSRKVQVDGICSFFLCINSRLVFIWILVTSRIQILNLTQLLSLQICVEILYHVTNRDFSQIFLWC